MKGGTKTEADGRKFGREIRNILPLFPLFSRSKSRVCFVFFVFSVCVGGMLLYKLQHKL